MCFKITEHPDKEPTVFQSVVPNGFDDQTDAVQQLTSLANFLEHQAVVNLNFFIISKLSITVVVVSSGNELNKNEFHSVIYSSQCVYGRKQVTFLSSPKQ